MPCAFGVAGILNFKSPRAMHPFIQDRGSQVAVAELAVINLIFLVPGASRESHYFLQVCGLI